MNHKNKTEQIKAKKNRFYSGVAVLTLSVIIVKVIGALFKVPMIKYIGIEGMGYFNAASHFYSLLMTVSTAGLPVALSILISRDLSRDDISSVKRNYRSALILFCSVGALFSLLMFVFAEEIANTLAIPDTKYSLRAVSPAVFLVTLSGAARGYFQGHSLMTPTAFSQVIESIGKLLFGLGFAFLALSRSKPPHIVAAYAIFGLTLGLLFSAVYLLILQRIHSKKAEAFSKNSQNESRRKTYIELLKIALPVTLSSAVLSLTTLLDTLVIPNALIYSGIDEKTALNLYSTYTNLALPLFALPSAFITPVSLVLVPAASSAEEKKMNGDRNYVLTSSFRLCAALTLPCAFGMGIFSYPILSLIFSDSSSAISIGARLLTVLSLSIFFSGLITVSNAMLQASGMQSKPIISLALGAGVKLLSEVLLVSLPAVNIYGAPISTFLCTLTVVCANFSFISDMEDISFSPYSIFCPSLLCSAISVSLAVLAYNLLYVVLPERVSLLLGILIAVLIYIPLTVKSKALPKEDILLFPMGEKICALLERLRLIKN